MVWRYDFLKERFGLLGFLPHGSRRVDFFSGGLVLEILTNPNAEHPSNQDCTVVPTESRFFNQAFS